MTYKVASRKAQEALRRVQYKHVGSCIEDLTPLQVREVLKAHIAGLEKQKEGADKFTVEMLKKKIRDVQDDIAKLNLAKDYGKNFANYICDVIKGEVTKVQWDIWVKKALENKDKAEQEMDKVLEEVFE